jgi:DNA-binding response OmpR family regulator
LLVVEDDVPIQQFLKRALLEAGYQVDTASNAKAGEDMALEGIHDAFIIDLGLPDLDGLDLISRCRAQGSAAPVLIPVRAAFSGRACPRVGAGRR